MRMPPHLYPLPALLYRPCCTGAGRGQGEGQVSLEMTDHAVAEKPIPFSRYKFIVHASHVFYIEFKLLVSRLIRVHSCPFVV
jgi:hypothetical protein